MTTPPLLNWLLLSTLALGAGWLLYYFGLRRERCFQYNRLLLLLAPPLAAALPLLRLPAAWLPVAPAGAPVPLRLLLPTVTVGAPAAAPAFEITTWLLVLYGAGVALLLGRLGWQLWQLRRFVRLLPAEAHAGYTLRRTGGRRPTGSFGRTVFWDDTAPLTAAEAAQMLRHELVHVRQHHTHDRLWLAVWRALLWPNPFVHLLPRALDLTHEYLADAAVAPAAPTAYVRLLARQATAWLDQAPALTHSFFSSSTLTRIAMLNRPNVTRRWKQWLALPVVGALLFVVSCEKSKTAGEVVAPQAKSVDQNAATPPPPVANEKRRVVSTEIRSIPGTDKSILFINGQRIPGELTSDEIKATIRSREGEPSNESKQPLDTNKTYAYVEQMPEPPGGFGELLKRIGENLRYPKVAIAEKMEGKVFVNFVVAKDGAIQQVKIAKGMGQEYVPGLTPPGETPKLQNTNVTPAARAMNEEALRVVRELPVWTPGRQNGQAVAVSFTIPVSFALK